MEVSLLGWVLFACHVTFLLVSKGAYLKYVLRDFGEQPPGGVSHFETRLVSSSSPPSKSPLFPFSPMRTPGFPGAPRLAAMIYREMMGASHPPLDGRLCEWQSGLPKLFVCSSLFSRLDWWTPNRLQFFVLQLCKPGRTARWKNSGFRHGVDGVAMGPLPAVPRP